MEYSTENLKLIQDAILECSAMLETMPPVEDGGSSNCDRVVIDFSRWRKNQLDNIPLLGYKSSSGLFKGFCSILFPSNGQGYNNTHRVEAAKNFLNGKGIDAIVHYQLD